MILGNKNDWWQPLQRRGVGRAGGGGEAAARRSREREGDLTAVVTSRDFRVREQDSAANGKAKRKEDS